MGEQVQGLTASRFSLLSSTGKGGKRDVDGGGGSGLLRRAAPVAEVAERGGELAGEHQRLGLEVGGDGRRRASGSAAAEMELRRGFVSAGERERRPGL